MSKDGEIVRGDPLFDVRPAQGTGDDTAMASLDFSIRLLTISLSAPRPCTGLSTAEMVLHPRGRGWFGAPHRLDFGHLISG